MNAWHVIPDADIAEHVTVGAECWCCPEIEDNGESLLVVHRSADGREDFESGAREPS